VQYDLKFMLAVLNWGTTVGDGRGGALLERNPFKGFPVPHEENPRRPRLQEEEYAALLEHAPAVSIDLELALILAHETGHRLSSIRQLRWSDVDVERGVAHWRAEHDKIRHEHETPLTPAAVEALERSRRRFALIGRAVTGDVWIFPGARQDGGPTPRSTFLKWWAKAEELAKLPPAKGRGFHSLRRKFASELRKIPLRDLCDLGGWKSAATVLTCYQTPDEATMREALEQRARRHAGGEK
jgi:integrase